MYIKKNGLIYNLKLYIHTNFPLIIVGYTTVYFFDKYTENIPFMTLLTLFFLMGWTYYSHMVFHETKWFENFDLHKYHHDKILSEKWQYRMLEFFIDIFIFGGIILIPIGMAIEHLINSRMFNYYGILFWSLLYSTYHFNWHFLPSPNPHSHHHEYLHCNYGPDIIDILFGTKMDEDLIEDMNSAIFNILVIFILFFIFRKQLFPFYEYNFNKKYNNKTNEYDNKTAENNEINNN
jgi:hypothetical protein